MRIIKNIIKRIFCKHEYRFLGEAVWGDGTHDLTVRCVKCGKEIDLIYKKVLTFTNNLL